MVQGNAASENEFRRFFVLPAPVHEAFVYCRPFVAVDGTFLKGRFQQILLLTVSINTNGKNLTLAWAVVESESRSS
jgi:hypothetical protein